MAQGKTTMAQRQRRAVSKDGPGMQLLHIAGGFFLISFGAVRLDAGTSGTADTITLVACIASGSALLVVVVIGAWKTHTGRRR